MADRALVTEGVALVVIGVIAVSLFLYFSLAVLGPMAPMRGSYLEENPTYAELFYNVSALANSSGRLLGGWVEALVMVSEESPSYLIQSVDVVRGGGSPQVVQNLSKIAGTEPLSYELETPFLNSPYIMSQYPSRVIVVGGVPYSVSAEPVNVTYAGVNVTGTLYYQLSTGFLVEASLREVNASSGALYQYLNYTLINVTVLSPLARAPARMGAGVLMFSLAVLAAVGGAGLVIGADRLVRAM